jgi:hypothetical protein
LGGERFIHAFDGRGVVITAYARPWSDRIAAAFSFSEHP